MTKKEILAVACKVLGIVSAFAALHSLGVATSMMKDALVSGQLEPVLRVLSWFVIPAAAALALIIWSGPIAGLLCGREAHDVVRIGMGKQELQGLAFSVIGLWLAATAAISIAGLACTFVTNVIQGKPLARLASAHTMAKFVQLVVGLFLLFSARGIAVWLTRFFSRLRTAGRAPGTH
jgi:hypothetical protein